VAKEIAMAVNRIDDEQQQPPDEPAPPAVQEAPAAEPLEVAPNVLVAADGNDLAGADGELARAPAPAPAGDGGGDSPPPPVEPKPPPAVAAATTDPAAADGTTPSSTEDQLPEASAGLKLFSWTVACMFAGAEVLIGIGALAAKLQQDNKFLLTTGRWCALLFGVGTIAFGLLILQLLNSGKGVGKGYGILRPLIGKDRRFSTSLTQLGLWTIALCTGFAYLLGRVMFDGSKFDVVVPSDRWDEYLLLLGGPFAAAVLAKGIVTYKLQEGTLQKSEPSSTTPTQVVKGDDGTADLVDAQYLLFNVVALGYYVVQLSKTSILPEIPSPLLALTGATAAAFVANKAAQRNTPTVTSVLPLTAEAGDKVTIYGTNFDPGDKQDLSRRVTIGLSGFSGTIPAVGRPSDTSASFLVPWAAQAGHQTVRLTTTAGVETEPHDLEIRSKLAEVTGIDAPGSLRPGSDATLSGRNLGKPGDRVAVKIDTMLAEGTPAADGSRLRFRVPDYLPSATSETVKVTLAVPGQADVSWTAPLEQPRILSAWRQGNLVEMRASGLSRETADFLPVVLVNSRTAPQVRHLQTDRYTVALPEGLDIATELSLVAFDDRARKSAEYNLGKEPSVPAQ
jgi:hypothetical protein